MGFIDDWKLSKGPLVLLGEKASRCLQDIKNWMTSNFLLLNSDKAEVINCTRCETAATEATKC